MTAEETRRRAEALEDAFGELAAAAASVASGFRHLRLGAMDDPETREEATAVADKVAEAFGLLLREGFYDRPHDPAQRRAVVVLDAEEIESAAGYMDDGIGDEWARLRGDAGGSAAMSPVEMLVLPAVTPFVQYRQMAEDLLSPTGGPDLDLSPYFSAEAQETFTVGCRVFLTRAIPDAKEGAEGVYLGRHLRLGAVVSLDTRDGSGYTVTVPFDAVRNLYR